MKRKASEYLRSHDLREEKKGLDTAQHWQVTPETETSNFLVLWYFHQEILAIQQFFWD